MHIPCYQYRENREGSYHHRLQRLGIANTAYYYIYYWGLFLFGEEICNRIIRGIKKLIGKTPKL